MTEKRVIAKLRNLTNQEGVIQKLVTIPKQEETKDWEKGDLIKMEKLE